MLFYLTGMRTVAAVLVWTAVLSLCGCDAKAGSAEEDREPAAGRKAASSPAAVISVLGVRG
jgi:hypothetical protein